MERQVFVKRLDRLAQNALRSNMPQKTVDDMYWGLLENYDNDFSEVEDQLIMLENNVDLVMDRDYIEMGVAA